MPTFAIHPYTISLAFYVLSLFEMLICCTQSLISVNQSPI